MDKKTGHWNDHKYKKPPVQFQIGELADEIGRDLLKYLMNDCKIPDDDFKYLNRIYRVTDSGHLIERLSRETIVRQRRKLKKYKRLLDEGVVPYNKIQNQYQSWIGSFRKQMSKAQIESMNNLYNKLFIEEWR